MNTKEIKQGLSRLQTLVEGWQNGEISAMERDVALEELRRIYALLRFGDDTTATPETPETVEEESAEPEVEVELIMSNEDESEPKAESETELETEHEAESELETETASEAEPQSAPQSDKQTEQPAEPAQPAEKTRDSRRESDALFDDKDMILPRHARRSVIMSLYNDDIPQPNVTPAQERPTLSDAECEKDSEKATDAEAEQSVPKAAQETHAQGNGNKVLGEVLRSADKTLGDTIARPKDIAASAPVQSLRRAIGINDRFLLIRDLFGGDEKAYERAIVAIDSFDNLDDCMVHIVENYSWRSESDGAKLIMDLLQRKFGK